MVMLLQLLALWRLGVLRLALLDIRLQLSNLLVDIGNVLFDDVGEFLGDSVCSELGSGAAERYGTHANLHRPIIKQCFPLRD